MHTGENERCVFSGNGYHDCKGKHYEYTSGDSIFSADGNDRNKDFTLEVCVNMREHTFAIYDGKGKHALITDIPDERVICFELHPVAKITVTDQSLQWVS